jgi:hypothetical protein
MHSGLLVRFQGRLSLLTLEKNHSNLLPNGTIGSKNEPVRMDRILGRLQESA